MTKNGILSLLLTLLLSAGALAQVSNISIAAGSPEDKALQTIAMESDTQKRMEQYQQFVREYASNPAAVAYAYSQMAQIAQGDGKLDEALALGDKALAALPNSMELLVAQISIAQEKKDTDKLLDYAAMAAKAYDGIDTQPKPAGMSDDDFQMKKNNDKTGAKPSYDYAESAAFNAAANEPDSQKRVDYLERYTAAFPNARFSDQAAEMVLVTYQQLNQPAKLVAFGEKLLAQKPDSVATLILLADHYAEAPATVAKSLEYAQRALKLAAPEGGEQNAMLAASAKSIIGYAYLKQEKYAAAVMELEGAAPMLKDNVNAYSAVLYRLGFAYAKLKRFVEARKVLDEAIAQGGPYKPLAENLLKKIEGATRRR
jgi:tetratricopeptide (TPR) repeat protein